MKTRRIFPVCLLAALLCMPAAQARKPVSLASLLEEMTDREALARFPDPYCTCRQSSSYDRASVVRGGEGWYANADYNQFIRSERRDGHSEHVMMDAEGPGSIVRLWLTSSAENGREGILRIYLDGSDTPAVEGKAWEIVSGDKLAGAPLSASVSPLTILEHRGHDLYLPIPYARHCKVTYQYPVEPERDAQGKTVFPGYFFYNINYRTYDPRVRVVTFSAAQLDRNKTLLGRVRTQLTRMDRGLDRMKLRAQPLDAELGAEQSRSLTIRGVHAIRRIGLRLDAVDREQALRSTVLEMRFDGEKTVWIPLGDFFGIGYRPLNSNNWYMQTEADGRMDAYWIMPFRDSCTVTLHNYGKQPVRISDAEIAYGDWKWDDRSMHFGTSWHLYDHRELGWMIDRDGGECTDVNYALLKGEGVYAGSSVALCNASPGWWGEGDEKVFVDGESFPSHFGTGSEDYYGYAWCIGNTFTGHPFIAQPDGGGNNAATFTVNTRVLDLDAIPFRRSLDFNIEQYNRIDYATTAYWYMRPGGISATPDDLRGVRAKVSFGPEDMFPPKLTLGIEAEALRRIDASKGAVAIQSGFGNIWSGRQQVYWSGIRPGDRLTLGFDSEYAGTYTLEGLFTLAPDYGKFDVRVNGRQVASSLDLYAPEVTVRTFSLGEVDLLEGENTIVFELGVSPAGMGNCCFGIDRLTFAR